MSFYALQWNLWPDAFTDLKIILKKLIKVSMPITKQWLAID
jgi:hypothetical protein